MPRYRNDKPSVIGLSHKGDSSPRLIKPGEEFDAEKDEVPKSYFDQGWVAEVKGAAARSSSSPGEGPPPGSTQTTGPEPVQGSGTSMEESVTDAEAAASKAYERGSTPAERGALRDEALKDAEESGSSAARDAQTPATHHTKKK